MSILAMIPVIGKILDKGLDVIDDLVPDKDLANKLKAGIRERAMVQNHQENIKLLDAQMKIILAEAKGGWLQRNWRPVLMLTIVAIVFNNYLLYPYLALFFSDAPYLTLPDHLWSLMKIGVGGYVVSRGAEKIAKTITK